MTVNYKDIERALTETFRLERRPVAVAFRDRAPDGVAQFQGTEPSGCSFWRLASEGRTFTTVPGDHYNCPIGTYTHNLPLTEKRSRELEQMLALMAGVGYVRVEQMAEIPRLPEAPRVILYAPLGDTPVPPDAVIFSGRPGRVMLLQEAAMRAGVRAQAPLFGRPTCMALPAAIQGGLVASTGCVGNRVYTDLGEDELYVVIPGADLERVAAEACTIAAANTGLADYHRSRRQLLATE